MEYQWNLTRLLKTARIDCVRKTPVEIESFSDEQPATLFTCTNFAERGAYKICGRKKRTL